MIVSRFAVDLEVARPAERPSFIGVRGVLVDAGADATWVSAEALIRCGEFETIDEVVFAREGDLQLLGARTLGGFNAKADPRNKRLVPGGPRTAAAMAGHCA